MKITDFGFWFRKLEFVDPSWPVPWKVGDWSVTFPDNDIFAVYYDGQELYVQRSCDTIRMVENYKNSHAIKIKTGFYQNSSDLFYVGKILTLDDFEVIPNPHYRGT